MVPHQTFGVIERIMVKQIRRTDIAVEAVGLRRHPVNAKSHQISAGNLVIHATIVLRVGNRRRIRGLHKLDVRNTVEAVAHTVGRSSRSESWIKRSPGTC